MRDVASQVLDSGVPGYAARVDDGRRMTVTAAGVADRATGRPMTGRDQFEIGSVTKAFTATLVLQQVDRGRVDLDASIDRYLPGVVPGGGEITVRMLLNHTSGLFQYIADPGYFVRMEQDPYHVATEQELLDIAFAHGPVFPPGQGWNYSNTNYVLLGMLLRRVTGQTMPDLVRRNIAVPLGLRHTYYPDPYAKNTGPGYARGYSVSFGDPAPTYVDVSDRPLGGWAGAGGAIISTPDEVSRFLSALLRGRLFSPAALTQMKTTVPLPEEVGVPGGYGLGLFRLDTVCGTVWAHGGTTRGHHTRATATEDGKRTAVADVTATPGITATPQGEARYTQVVSDADTALTCRMLNRPVPHTVTRSHTS
ncbi:D-alanyl-D-alanine carboxypeptidase [Saccharothrix coeruleofusca]|uniref:serine hydrolase domain-containing protein n=1 Tax=Saccharothrix coeruleofusca TaxID=33919 RepID=UPI001AE2E51D|nr:serine hydrolase domain-containing protein [Saccharothrix coeruleofusca]MBP2334725.1 D-alanyl-D-alanine carboxypeptidase [Saccharothrix coeruleofusca]